MIGGFYAAPAKITHVEFFTELKDLMTAQKTVFRVPIVIMVLICIGIFLTALSQGNGISPFAYKLF
jgi:hypothetical protein